MFLCWWSLRCWFTLWNHIVLWFRTVCYSLICLNTVFHAFVSFREVFRIINLICYDCWVSIRVYSNFCWDTCSYWWSCSVGLYCESHYCPVMGDCYSLTCLTRAIHAFVSSRKLFRILSLICFDCWVSIRVYLLFCWVSCSYADDPCSVGSYCEITFLSCDLGCSSSTRQCYRHTCKWHSSPLQPTDSCFFRSRNSFWCRG